MTKNKPEYGTPEYEAACELRAKSSKAARWASEQFHKIVVLESKSERITALNRMSNYLLNLNSLLEKISEGQRVHFCACCGMPELANYQDPTKTRLIANGLCFGCDFWTEKRTTYNAQNRRGSMLVMGGWVYGDGGDKPNESGSFLGFGGSRWHLYQITTGKLWTTNNLWSAGDIPANFIPGMPDNAVSLTEEEFALATAGRDEVKV